MKLILDEWIVREVIDTLYMARTTFLGITGLDSPQDVEKKSANETAITRRISKAIDIIQQSEQPHIPESLEEAAREYATLPMDVGDRKICIDKCKRNAFIAGAQWQAEQDDRDVIFWKGMQHAIAGMKKDAVEGVIIDSGFDDGTAFVTMNIPDRRYDRGDKVKLIIIKDDGKSD